MRMLEYCKPIRLLLISLILIVIESPSALAQNPNASIWISPAELAAIKMEGEPWNQLKAAAKKSAGTPNLSDQNQDNNVLVMAKALVYVRCSLEPTDVQCLNINLDDMYNEVVDNIMKAIGTEGDRTLPLGRELAAYVIAADLVGLPADKDQVFRPWLRDVRYTTLGGRTLISTHEDRPNNWGTHAAASRVAAALYLGDTADLDRAATVTKGYLGDRSAYIGFKFGDLVWQCDPSKPVGINPKDCTREGHSIDGVVPDDQRRAEVGFTWPPPKENYVYEGLQGLIAAASMLHRAGYDIFNWEDKAIKRAYTWLYEQADFQAVGDDTWQIPLVDYYYGTSYWDGKKTRHGKNIGWTGWTHAKNTGGSNVDNTVPSAPFGFLVQ